MDVLDTLQISASGLVAERIRLQAISANLANARTTRTSEGIGPYQRRSPIFESVPMDAFGDVFDRELAQVTVADVMVAQSQGRAVYEPGHPDADASGMVRYPDIDILHEMVDLMGTARSYEANANVLDTTKALAMRALEIGK
jgi:flagellar basal-body rod protein FlgC